MMSEINVRRHLLIHHNVNTTLIKKRNKEDNFDIYYHFKSPFRDNPHIAYCRLILQSYEYLAIAFQLAWQISSTWYSNSLEILLTLLFSKCLFLVFSYQLNRKATIKSESKVKLNKSQTSTTNVCGLQQPANLPSTTELHCLFTSQKYKHPNI